MRTAIICASLMAGSIALTAPADAAIKGGHCPPPPSGFLMWDVDTEPYQADNRVDEQGNGNGKVCAKPGKLIIGDDGAPFQIYNFIDDAGTLPR